MKFGSTKVSSSKIQLIQPTNNKDTTYKRPERVCTASIYIKSTENIYHGGNDKMPPVLSLHRINGIEDDIKVNVRLKEEANQVYITAAAIHRHSDVSNQKRNSLTSNLNCVSICIIQV